MKFGNLFGSLAFTYLLLVDQEALVEAKHHGHHGHLRIHHGHHHKKKRGFLGKIFHKIKSGIGRIGRKILDIPPKHRSRFDKYPIYVIRYHQFIWHRYFNRYLSRVHDGRPNLPKTKCWNIKCWMRRNKFKRYWNWRAPIPKQGKNSPPFLHRRCRIPKITGGRCRSEHLRHDYYWRMFMWVGRYGFPKQPQRKRICITSYCRFQKKMWKRYWKNFFIYSSLIPVIRPYDYNWKFWMWRNHGNVFRLQQIVSPALMAMGMGHHMMGFGGGMMMGGMNMMMMGGNHHMTIEMKRALLAVMQRNLAQSMQVAQTSQYALQRQRMALMMLMRMPAYPSAISAQLQMQSMMSNMNYQQQMQQYRMQMMLRQQIMGMAQYLRGSCGCGMCSHSRMHYGMPSGASMYTRHNGMFGAVNPALMGRQMYGINGMGHMGHMGLGTMPYNAVNNPLELKMRVQALYNKNNVHGYA